MEMEKQDDAVGLQYWLRWQVPVCAFIFVAPTIVSLVLINRGDREPIKSTDLWVPCWRDLHPLWLLFYRAFAFVSMALLLYQTAVAFGPFVFYFYTQWTFTLVVVYFAMGTIISARGCWMYSQVSKDSKSESTTTFKEKETKGSIKLQGHHIHVQLDQRMGFWERFMQSVYYTCAGAVMLTDIVFWCLLLPFMTGENFSLTLLIGCMHSLNAVFLLLDSVLNSLPFPWYRLTYFVLWSCAYVVFQWVLHACGFTWWPYPFLDLSNPWAPLWYFGLALVHIPCYGLYVLLIKAKGSIFSRMFPQAFVRWY